MSAPLPPVAPGLSAFADGYDGFILDLWGVLHDGIRPYPGALDCLDRLAAAGKRVCLLSNAPRRVAAVAGILEPVKSRFTIVELEPDLDDWCKWALAAGLPIEVVAYARFKPDCILDYEPTADITNACCPRTLATAARWVARGLPGSARAGAAKGGKWQGMEFEALAGSIGEGRAAELCGFLQVWRSLPNIDQIIMSPKTAPVPPADEAGTLYALAGLLARRATQANFGSICQYMGRLPKDHGVLTMKMSTQKAPEVMQTAAYIQWAADNQDVML